MTDSTATAVSASNKCALGGMRLYVKVRVEDLAFLRRAAVEQVDPRIDPTGSIETILMAVLNSPEDLPATNGYELLPDCSVVQLDAEHFMLFVSATVVDARLLYEAACRVYTACWQDASWKPESASDALYELVLASNKNPSPCDLGFEIIDWSTKPFSA